MPRNIVWRPGAAMVTHFATDVDLVIGETRIPAGRYTPATLPSESDPCLIVSRAVRVFGSQYDPSKDLARIPLICQRVPNVTARLTLSVANGLLAIAWSDER